MTYISENGVVLFLDPFLKERSFFNYRQFFVARNDLFFIRNFGCRMSRVVILIKSFRFLELIRLHVNHLTTSSHYPFEHFKPFSNNKNVLKTLNMLQNYFHTKKQWIKDRFDNGIFVHCSKSKLRLKMITGNLRK